MRNLIEEECGWNGEVERFVARRKDMNPCCFMDWSVGEQRPKAER